MTIERSAAPLRILLLSVVASVAASVVAACGSTGDDRLEPVVESGVGVTAEGCGLAGHVGSGTLVDDGDGNGLVVTVAHTIKGATSVTVTDADGDEHEGRVVAFDKDADLAALDVPSLSAPSIPLASPSPIALTGSSGSILVWSRDDGVEAVPVVIAKRLRVTIEDIYIDEVVERTALEIEGPVSIGDSGGAVLDADGEVVGVVYANSRGRDDTGFATDRRELSDLLASITGDTVDNGTCF